MAEKTKTTAKKTTKEAAAEHAANVHKNFMTSLRGRTFEGTVVRKFPTRVAIEFERTVKAYKFDRFYKKKTRIHAKLPVGMDIHIGDYIKVMECRPLSKIIHHVVIEKIRSAQDGVKEAKK